MKFQTPEKVGLAYFIIVMCFMVGCFWALQGCASLDLDQSVDTPAKKYRAAREAFNACLVEYNSYLRTATDNERYWVSENVHKYVLLADTALDLWGAELRRDKSTLEAQTKYREAMGQLVEKMPWIFEEGK